MDPIIAEIEEQYMRDDLPAFAPGDTVRVRVRVVEGQKERVQAFEGVCIGRQGGRLSETFTVRRVSGGVGVERTFPLHSPSIAGIEVTRRGQVRRAKLYYLRARRGKRARVRERRWWLDAAREAEAAPLAEEEEEERPGPDEERPEPSEVEAEVHEVEQEVEQEVEPAAQAARPAEAETPRDAIQGAEQKEAAAEAATE